jgi:glutamyl-tRNA synthetase
MRELPDAVLAEELIAFLVRRSPELILPAPIRERLVKAMPMLKTRAKTLVELADKSDFLLSDGARKPDTQAEAILTPAARALLKHSIGPCFTAATSYWSAKTYEDAFRTLAEQEGKQLADYAQPLRVALTGHVASPPVFEVITVLGNAEALKRVQAQAGQDEK